MQCRGAECEYAFRCVLLNENSGVNKVEDIECYAEIFPDKQIELDTLYESIQGCICCQLYKSRNKIVFGRGNPEAKIILVGEAPGLEEDKSGLPFQGKAGKLLSSYLSEIGINENDLYISNIVHCRPTINLEGKKNRKPESSEVWACKWIIEKQIEIIQPKLIVALGDTAKEYFLGKGSVSITEARGKFFNYKGMKLLPTFHPSRIFMTGGVKSPYKKDLWNDLKIVKEFLDKE
jgi:uracil-DNA glycosylase